MPDTPITTSRTKSVSQVCALLAGAIGAIGLAGWVFDIPALQRIHPALVTMKANTAIALILLGFSLLLLQDEKVRGMKRWLAQGCAALVALLGLLTMGENLFGWDFGIDQFLFQESLAAAGRSFPGRMGVPSSVVFTFLGLAVFFLDTRLAGRYWATKLAVVAAAATTMVFLYYFYRIEQGDAVSKYFTIALHTVVAFYALCAAIFFARPARGVMQELLGTGMGSMVARRMLPGAFLLPVLLGWLRTYWSQSGVFGAGLGTAVFVVWMILIFSVLILWTIRAINGLEAEGREAQAAQARLAAIVTSCEDAIISKSLDGTITSWNAGAQRTFGYTAEEMIGQSVLRLCPPDLSHEEAGILTKLSAGEHVEHHETERLTKAGTRLAVSLTISPIRNAAGIVIGASKIVRDITDRKRAENALRESEERFRALVTATADVVYCMNPDWTQMLWLDGQDFVMDTEEPRLTWLQEYILPEDQPRVMAGIQEAIRTKSIFEMEHHVQRVDGSFGWTFSRAIPLLNADGQIVEWFGTLSDETARKQAEEAMRESEERFRLMADNIAQLAWMADAEGKIFWYNQRWFDYTGTTLEEMQGWGWKAVHHPDHIESVVEKWTAHLKKGEPWEDTFPLRGTDGQYRWFLSRAVPICDAGGIVQRWFGTNTDVTDQRAAVDALARAKEHAEAASRAKDDFLAALSHELRTPLTPVLMTASSLEGDTSLSSEVREQLSMMRRNIELEARLIDDLLDLTRISRGMLTIAPVVTDVHELLSHTAEIVLSDRLGKEVSIVFKQEAVRHHVLADPTRLQQVFWNLIKNAIKFTPAGGSIIVTTRNDAQCRIILSVEDTGVGISTEALPRIFKAFEQGDASGQHRYGGLGLGLAISRAIMEAHGGTISVESEGRDCGAIFTVALASVDAPAAPSHDSATVSGSVRTLRLLIVEDHETTRTVLAQLLARRGHQVTTAGTVQDALSAYAAGQFDAVISDLGLPDGSGLDLMREIQRQRPVPAIALSGYGMEDDVRRTQEAGFFAHLVKPVNIDQLRQLIDQIAPNAKPES